MPDGYGNMSSTYFFGRAATLSGSAIGPAGFGASKVPSASHRSCHRVSISAARSAVYRYGGAPPPPRRAGGSGSGLRGPLLVSGCSRPEKNPPPRGGGPPAASEGGGRGRKGGGAD